MQELMPACLTSFRHLSGFVAVCDTGSVTRAAEQLRRAKSAVSRSIHEIEQALNVTLFERDAGRLQCNIFGRAIYTRTTRALDAFSLGWHGSAVAVGQYTHFPSGIFHEARLAVMITLADVQDVTVAAARLGITTAVVTRSVNFLERSLNQPLFVRTPDRMTPTDATLIFAAQAERTLRELRQLASDVAALQDRGDS